MSMENYRAVKIIVNRINGDRIKTMMFCETHLAEKIFWKHANCNRRVSVYGWNDGWHLAAQA